MNRCVCLTPHEPLAAMPAGAIALIQPVPLDLIGNQAELFAFQ